MIATRGRRILAVTTAARASAILLQPRVRSLSGGKQTPDRVGTIFGTMSIPQQLDPGSTQEALKLFKAAGHVEVDTAIMYDGGETERALGVVGLCKDDSFEVATKANPWFKDGRTHGNEPVAGLQGARVKEQLRLSLASLRTDTVHLFYLHAPDYDTPLEETLLAVHELREEGLFVEWGLSNYTAWEVAHIWNMCKMNNWQPPSVYQGMYNSVTRAVEAELIPCLRRLDMRFYAFNPLAGGILSGKYKFDEAASTGRYAKGTVMGDRYRERFWHKETFDALDNVKTLCSKHDVTLPKAALKWMYHHSALSKDHRDAVIVCGSSVAQIEGNLEVSVDDEPLHQELADGFEGAWVACKPRCPPYFR